MTYITNNINEINKKTWNSGINNSPFLKYNFIKCYFDTQSNINHWFILNKQNRIYANSFVLSFEKAIKLTSLNFLYKVFKLLRIEVLYLANTYLTSIPSFSCNSEIELEDILLKIKNNNNYKVAIIPDFLFKKTKDLDVFKIEVDSEMILNINSEWNNFNDYKDALKTKYRKRIRKALESSNNIKVIALSESDFDKYDKEILNLFNLVFKDTHFSGPEFNTKIIKRLLSIKMLKLDGYFLGDTIVAFTSDIQHKNKMYSYFVGFDKKINKKYELYSRILIEQIKKAIYMKCDKLILGRTANEFKSNFGAYPEKSYIYLYFRNKFWKLILSPVINLLKAKKWIIRMPFKK